MSLFTATTTAEAVVLAPREDIWAVLSDPELLARLTPLLKRIVPDGDLWRWEMTGIDVLGVRVAPTFTERMLFDAPARIDFHHEPPAGQRERSGVEGWYDLREVEDGTSLSTSLEITLDLPLPKVSGPAVRATMGRVVTTMGDRFSRNLLAHLQTTERR